jgi:hypothetical protein
MEKNSLPSASSDARKVDGKDSAVTVEWHCIDTPSKELLLWQECAKSQKTTLDEAKLTINAAFESSDASPEFPDCRRGHITWIYANYMYIAGGYHFSPDAGASWKDSVFSLVSALFLTPRLPIKLAGRYIIFKVIFGDER